MPSVCEADLQKAPPPAVPHEATICLTQIRAFRAQLEHKPNLQSAILIK